MDDQHGARRGESMPGEIGRFQNAMRALSDSRTRREVSMDKALELEQAAQELRSTAQQQVRTGWQSAYTELKALDGADIPARDLLTAVIDLHEMTEVATLNPRRYDREGILGVFDRIKVGEPVIAGLGSMGLHGAIAAEPRTQLIDNKTNIQASLKILIRPLKADKARGHEFKTVINIEKIMAPLSLLVGKEAIRGFAEGIEPPRQPQHYSDTLAFNSDLEMLNRAKKWMGQFNQEIGLNADLTNLDTQIAQARRRQGRWWLRRGRRTHRLRR